MLLLSVIIRAELGLFFELCEEGIPDSGTLERWRLILIKAKTAYSVGLGVVFVGLVWF